MGRNVEIKAKLNSTEFDAVYRCAQAIATEGPFELQQTDSFFQTKQGRLKLREFGDGTAELIFYVRPDSHGPKTSEYIRSECVAAETMKQALDAAYGITGVIRKHRTVFLAGPTRIHLDRVVDLGTFLELEVVMEDNDAVETGEQIANDLMKQLEINPSQLISGAYFDLLITIKK